VEFDTISRRPEKLAGFVGENGWNFCPELLIFEINQHNYSQLDTVIMAKNH